jgi:threonine/homoserine/homoserine lactone efflux protein
LPFNPHQPIAIWWENDEVPIELLVAVATFGFVTAITPGPNNSYLLASGANHGTRKSLIFVNGIMLGLGSMLSAIGLGLGAVFLAVPMIYDILKYVGFGYIVYLAYKVIRSGYKSGPDQVEVPRFFNAFLLQFVNPKAWIVCTSFMATYAPVDLGVGAVAICIAIFLITTYPGAVAWAVMGQGISKVLTNPTRLRLFNWTAGILLVATMVPALFI